VPIEKSGFPEICVSVALKKWQNAAAGIVPFRHFRAGNIEVELEYASAHLRVLVRDDNGSGIDPQVLGGADATVTGAYHACPSAPKESARSSGC
jgi:hypothetical protein